MARLKCIISYDGSEFHGFQFQPGERTIAGELEKALTKMHKGDYIRIQASGRTDAGVHAIGQVIHFDSPYDIADDNWKVALNTLLPDDIYVKRVTTVPDDFHARYDVEEKEYRYFVWNSQEPDIFKRNYVFHFPYAVNMEKVEAACRYLEGTHDFTTFSSAKASAKGSKVRTIKKITCLKDGPHMAFIFRGNGFLYNMVRIIVSVLLDVGQGRKQPGDIPELLAAKDRRQASKTIAAQGLYLWKVTYKQER